MKIVTVVGARPQFIKAAAVSRVLRQMHEEILIHTGQHYDSNMSDIFFDELKIPKPDYNLNVGSGSHAVQTSKIMIGVEEILLKEKPDFLNVYGDTNSTLGAALAASKILIPIMHIEAGLRSYNMNMPEEQNRVLTDRISTVLFCPTETAVNNLSHEGITRNVFNVGDVMCDAVLYYSKLSKQKDFKDYFEKLEFENNPRKIDSWYLATVHRAENTDDVIKIEHILAAFEQLDHCVIFPVHPRTRKMVMELNEKYQYKNIAFVKPIGYLDMLFFIKNAVKVVTDSGGLQKESYILSTPCVTVRDQTEWVETLTGNHNILAKPNYKDIVDKVLKSVVSEFHPDLYGSGKAAEEICSYIDKFEKEQTL